MKDITSTTFGLLIAFFMPGIVALYAVSYWSDQLQDVFQTFITSPSNVGLFFLVLLGGLAIGLQISLVRWIVFEKLLSGEIKLETKNFSKLSNEDILTSFRACVDEHYRYHQFWGGMVFVLPILHLGWGLDLVASLSDGWKIFWWVIFIAIEVLTIAGAKAGFSMYVERSNKILQGDENA